jgi:hypothetical protein
MAFDFSNATKVKMKRKAPKSGKKTFEQALDTSLTETFDKQIAIIKAGIPTSNNMPSAWSKIDMDGNTFIQWRINGKPVYFTEELVKENGWIHTNNAEGDLAGIRKSITEGNHKKELMEAFNRPSAKEIREIAKEQELAEFKAMTKT